MEVIKKKRHLGIVYRFVNHPRYKNKAPISYLVGRIRQMFPEYRADYLHKNLTKQIKSLCDWSN